MNYNSENFFYTFYSLIGLLSIFVFENLFITNRLFLSNKLQHLLHILHEKFKKENNNSKEKDTITNEFVSKKIEHKYEDKFIDFIKNNSYEYIFTEDEEIQKLEIIDRQFKSIKNSYEDNMKELYGKLNEVKNEIKKLNDMTNEDFYKIYCDFDDDTIWDYNFNNMLNNTDIIDEKNKVLINIEIDISKIQNNIDDQLTIQKMAETYATNFIIDKRLEKLNGCFVMESTPLGNVLMTYNKDKKAFIYYSDNTIPYRYLEVVGRKFVKVFNFRPIFVDMEEELKLYEKKLQENEEEKNRILQRDEESQKNMKIEDNKPQNKNVFAKLKNYNKPSAKITSAPPPKNNTSNVVNENRKFILKENANRYTYNGKISTFNPLKKVERKALDKKYAMTFADFKKLQMKTFLK
jgi:hypothetical protein